MFSMSYVVQISNMKIPGQLLRSHNHSITVYNRCGPPIDFVIGIRGELSFLCYIHQHEQGFSFGAVVLSRFFIQSGQPSSWDAARRRGYQYSAGLSFIYSTYLQGRRYYPLIPMDENQRARSTAIERHNYGNRYHQRDQERGLFF